MSPHYLLQRKKSKFFIRTKNEKNKFTGTLITRIKNKIKKFIGTKNKNNLHRVKEKMTNLQAQKNKP